MLYPNHTGTIYSFFHVRHGGFFHTTDVRILNEVAVTGVLHPGRPVVIGGVKYRVTDIAVELLAGNPKSAFLPQRFIGKPSSFNLLAEIWVEDAY